MPFSGWITGHSYVTYGPLLNGATSVIFEGTPFYPDNNRFWAVVQKYKVNTSKITKASFMAKSPISGEQILHCSDGDPRTDAIRGRIRRQLRPFESQSSGNCRQEEHKSNLPLQLRYNRVSFQSEGEPINPESWHWYYKYVGGSRCSIVDTYWQVPSNQDHSRFLEIVSRVIL